MVGFLTMRLGGQDHIPEALPIGQLAEHQYRKLVPTGEVLHISVAVVCFNGKDKFKSARSKNPCNFLTYSNFKELF